MRSWSAPLLSPTRSMSLVNCRLNMGLPLMEMGVWWLWSVACIIFSWTMLNRMGESKHPWRTPTIVLKNSPSWLFKTTALLGFSCSAWMAWTRPSSMLKLLRTCHRPEHKILSNVFSKPMKLQNRLQWCLGCLSMMSPLLKICSTVLWPNLKPACSSASSSSALILSWLRITWGMILYGGWLIRLMIQQFWHCSMLAYQPSSVQDHPQVPTQMSAFHKSFLTTKQASPNEFTISISKQCKSTLLS